MSDWSPSEKKVARRAYEAAREAVPAKVLAEFKARAAAATSIEAMWDVGDFLEEQGRELNDLLDYRYSQLHRVFGQMIVEGYLDADKLAGLSADNLEKIQYWVSQLSSRRPDRSAGGA